MNETVIIVIGLCCGIMFVILWNLFHYHNKPQKGHDFFNPDERWKKE